MRIKAQSAKTIESKALATATKSKLLPNSKKPVGESVQTRTSTPVKPLTKSKKPAAPIVPAEISAPRPPNIATTVPAARQAQALRLHYRRSQGDYEGWGVHLWNVENPVLPSQCVTQWESPQLFQTEDRFGKALSVPLEQSQGEIGLIIHKGDEKDTGPDIILHLAQGQEIWLMQGYNRVFLSEEEALRVTA